MRRWRKKFSSADHIFTSVTRHAIGKNLILLILLGVVVYLTLIPLIMILYGTFRDGPPGTAASFTLVNYVRAYGDLSLFKLAWSTMVFAAGAAIVSFGFGAFLAWVTERTDTPFKGMIYGLALFPFVIPGILTTIAWVLLLSPKIGWINRFFIEQLGFSSAPFNLYSMAGMIWVFGIDNITLPFFLMAASFRSMDPALEEAGRASGMGGLTTFWHVNLKLMIPTILAVLLLLVVRGIETFEVPAVIGLPAEIKVYASEIFLALRMYQPPDYNLAGTYSTFYLVVASVGVALYLKATASSEKYATITGKGYRPRTQRLGRWRYLTLLLSSLILFIGVILPFLVVALTSVLPIYQRPSRELLSALTLDNYRTVLGLDMFYQALFNNVVVGILSATAAAVLAAAVAWVVVRTRLRGRKLLDVVAFTPMAFPGIVIGLALLWMYLTLPIPVYGTLWILVIAYVTKYVPIALRACHTALLQLHPELEEASVISGSSWLRTFVRVVLPLILPGVAAGWFYVLALTFKALSLPVLLSHLGTEVLPVVIYGLYESGRFSELSALGVLLIVALSVVALGTRLFATHFSVHER
jgi:iron(III) transport system permease protein